MVNSIRIAVSLSVALLLSGCETLSYYLQAIGGQLELMARSQPVDRLLADPATPQALRERLELSRSIRDYAVKELKLPDNASYREYADLGRPYVVWNVVAAPEFSVDALQSCFPVAGCVSYRGFFARENAERHATRLKGEGNDVFVYGVPAYSTLGRFDDPLLSTFIRFPEAELARLVFHELAHQVVYLKGDSTFNESFAVAVEREGVRRWLAAQSIGERGTPFADFLGVQETNRKFLDDIGQLRARLKAIYGMPLPAEAMRERKAAELAPLRARLQANARFAGQEPNNALLASFSTYTQLVPMFEKLLAEEGGDLARFYEKVKKLASEPSSRDPSSAPSR